MRENLIYTAISGNYKKTDFSKIAILLILYQQVYHTSRKTANTFVPKKPKKLSENIQKGQ